MILLWLSLPITLNVLGLILVSETSIKIILWGKYDTINNKNLFWLIVPGIKGKTLEVNHDRYLTLVMEEDDTPPK